MTFSDLIRAVKADLKHDSSIVKDYDWKRLMGFKELDIKRFDELVDIIKNLRVNDRFLNGARNGLGFSALIPIYRPNFIHKVVDGFNLATLVITIKISNLLNIPQRTFYTKD